MVSFCRTYVNVQNHRSVSGIITQIFLYNTEDVFLAKNVVKRGILLEQSVACSDALPYLNHLCAGAKCWYG